MHTALILFCLGLAAAGSLFCAVMLARVRPWAVRRLLQGAALLLPALVLGGLALGMAHFLAEICFLAAPPADAGAARALVVLGGLSLLAGLLLQSARHLWGRREMDRRTWPAPVWLQERVGRAAAAFGLRRTPDARVCIDAYPWALVTGLLRTRVVVSSGLVALLDAEELDAVLCHELVHLRQGDLWWAAIAAGLRDLSWFLPTSHRVYRQLRAEMELACDDLVPGAASRLALASALARVWQAGLVGLPPAPRGLGLAGAGRIGQWERRVQRLLAAPPPPGTSGWSRAALSAAAVLTGTVLLQFGATLWTMTLVGCNFSHMGLMLGAGP